MHEARESHLVSTSNIHQIQPSAITGSFFGWLFLFAVAKGTFYHLALTEIQLER